MKALLVGAFYVGALGISGATTVGLLDIFGLERKPQWMVAESLSYEDGWFTQTHEFNVDMVQARWAANIYASEDGNTLHDGYVCSGGGLSSYSPEKGADTRSRTFIVDDWVGAKCDMVPGMEYTGLASWHYTGDEGRAVTTHASVTFVFDGLSEHAPDNGD